MALRLTEGQVRSFDAALAEFAANVSDSIEPDLCADWLAQHAENKYLEDVISSCNAEQGALMIENAALKEKLRLAELKAFDHEMAAALEAESAALKVPPTPAEWMGQGGTERVEVEPLDVATMQAEMVALRKVAEAARAVPLETVAGDFYWDKRVALEKALSDLDALRKQGEENVTKC